MQVEVSGNPRKVSKTRLGAVFGPIFSSKRYFIHNSNLTNTLRGIIERVFVVKRDGRFQPPPRPQPRLFAKLLLPEFRALTTGPLLRPLTIDDTVRLWTGSKQKVYARALETLRSSGLTRKDSYLSTFVKCEKIDGSKTNPAPRVIQPRNPRYNLHLASFLKPHEHEFYRRLDKMFDTDGLGDRTVFKGLNARATAEHLILKSSRYTNPVFVGLDASRFDQHVSDVALRWEHSIYLNCFLYGHSRLEELLEWQIHNRGVARLRDGRIDYSVEGRRMSGDMNTSLGNCILMCSLVHAYMRPKGVKYSLANNGDDCVLILERGHLKLLDDLPEWFLAMGFDMKVEPPVFDLRQVSFCQVNVLTSPNYNICVRNPHVVLSKDLHSTYPFTHEHQYLQWLIASGECGRTSHGGVPILEAFYGSFPEGVITDRRVANELENWRKYSIVGGGLDIPISDEMRHSMWVAFGVTPDCQIALENVLRKVRFGTNQGDITGTPYSSIFQGNI